MKNHGDVMKEKEEKISSLERKLEDRKIEVQIILNILRFDLYFCTIISVLFCHLLDS